MKTPTEVLEEKMNELISLNQHLLAVELYKGGVSKADIGKHLKIAKSTIVRMLKGYERNSGQDDPE